MKAPTPTVSLHVTTYAPDIPFYRVMLLSLRTFVKGWTHLTTVVPQGDGAVFREVHKQCDIGMPWNVVEREEVPGKGHNCHWCHHMSADLWSSAEYITFIDPDVWFVQTTTPERYFTDEAKAVLDYIHWHENSSPWKEGTERAIGPCRLGETMQRFPITYFREMLPALRRHVQDLHQCTFWDYFTNLPGRYPYGGFAEFVAMGNFAWERFPGRHEAMHVHDRTHWRPDHIIQLWSHAGLDGVVPDWCKRDVTPDVIEKKSGLTGRELAHWLFPLYRPFIDTGVFKLG